MPDRPALILAYDNLRDPRDLAEAIHLAAGFGAEVHLIGKSLEAGHWKVLRKLRSWRPGLAEEPGKIGTRRFRDIPGWIEEVRAAGFSFIATALEGGEPPRKDPALGKVAVLFGEETGGLPEEALRACDRLWTIPLGPGGKFYTVGQATALVLGALMTC